MAKVDRCPSGIDGFDALISGGFPRNRSIMISGGCGTGKTSFAIEFLLNGISKFGETGVFVALEQNPKLLRLDALTMGYDLEKFEREGKLRIIDGSLCRRGEDAIVASRASSSIPVVTLPEKFTIAEMTKQVIDVARQINARRVVIDSVTSIDEVLCGGSEIRQIILDLNYALQDAELTSLLVFDTLSDEQTVSKQGVEEYVSDGVVLLKANEAFDT